jgi:hypothetical protein
VPSEGSILSTGSQAVSFLFFVTISEQWRFPSAARLRFGQARYDPFPDTGEGGPRSIALSVVIQSGIAYFGTVNSGGLVFGFDYSQPSVPRLIAMTLYGEQLSSLISGFGFYGSDIFVVGSLGADTGVVQADNFAPRNVIELYYPPLALRDSTFSIQAYREEECDEISPSKV